MKIGLFLSAHHPAGEATQEHVDRLLEQARTADELGFDSLFLGHHYLARSAFLQPVPLAGHLAAITERARIGFGVYLLALHGPVEVAEQLATLDVLSGGRVIAGFGTGYREKEYAALGVPYDERFRRLDEAIGVIRRLWRGEAVTADGRFGSLREARLNLQPHQPGGPPIWLGAFGDRGIRRVAEHDACWLAPPEGDAEALRERLELLRAELANRGLPLERDYPIARECFVAPTREQALATARDHLLRQYDGYRSWEQAQRIDGDAFLERHALIGTPDEVLERLRGFEDDLGVTHVVLRMQWDGMPHADALRAIRLLGQEVVPAA